MSGKYKVKCVDKNNQASYTREMGWNTHLYWVVQFMEQDCSGLYEKLEWVGAPNAPTYNENGLKIRFRFKGLNEDPGQFEIVSSTTSPLSAKDLVLKAETILPYGTNLFYNPLPFEFLKTYEEKP